MGYVTVMLIYSLMQRIVYGWDNNHRRGLHRRRGERIVHTDWVLVLQSQSFVGVIHTPVLHSREMIEVG